MCTLNFFKEMEFFHYFSSKCYRVHSFGNLFLLKKAGVFLGYPVQVSLRPGPNRDNEGSRQPAPQKQAGAERQGGSAVGTRETLCPGASAVPRGP